MVIDASVAVRWFVEGPHSAEAFALLNRAGKMVAPGLFLSEVANALFKYVRDGALSADEARRAYGVAPTRLHQLIGVSELNQDAFELCLALMHPIYDCYYLALALRTSDVFVTADQRFLRKLSGTRFAPHAMHLSEAGAV